MQKIITSALDEIFSLREEMLAGLKACLIETKAESRSSRIEEINEAVAKLQEEMVHNTKCDVDFIALKIARLRDEKNALYAASAQRVDIKNNIQNMMDYINERVEESEAYDEVTIRKLVSKVKVYDNYCTVEFKPGLVATVNL